MRAPRISSTATLVAVAFLSLTSGCHDSSPLPTSGGGLPTPTATVKSPGGGLPLPTAVFDVSPKPGSDGVVRGGGNFRVTFNICNTVHPDPGHDELYFTFDFLGDGSATHAGTTGSDCRQTFLYQGNLDVKAQLCVVDRDPVSHKERHEYQCHDYAVSVRGACHPVSALATNNVPKACPSGYTQTCDATALVATSSAQAHEACDLCFGEGTCQEFVAGAWSQAFATSGDYWYTTNGSPFCPINAGDILNNCPTVPPVRWAP